MLRMRNIGRRAFEVLCVCGECRWDLKRGDGGGKGRGGAEGGGR